MTIDNRHSEPRIIMVTGGQRSGKSAFAESLALNRSPHPTYLATARVFDDEMKQRVRVHQERRGELWRNIEAPLGIDSLCFSKHEVVLIDCLTLWAMNWMFEKNENIGEALSALKSQISLVMESGAIAIIVTNEIGLGGVSENELQRKFTDLQGMINQYVSSIADEVYMVVSGIPMKIKSLS